MKRIQTIFTKIHWGGFSFVSLYISVLSGLVVGFQYDPASPLYSVSTLDMLVPYGAYFRSLHFYSSQLFFLFCLCHLIGIFGKTENYSSRQWIMLTATLPVALLILFSGYVLRGDATGSSAGMIAEAILLDIPVIGGNINDLLFSISDNGMKRIYINHIIGFGLLWGWLAWGHVKKYRVSVTHYTFLCITILLFSALVAAPFEADHLGIIHIAGPWFFLGLQELLRYLPPLLAGIIYPASLLLSLALLQKKNRFFTPLLIYILFWLFSYTVLTGIALTR